jgi:hypothetical protein
MTKGDVGLALIWLSSARSTGGGHADFDLKRVPGTNVFASEKDFDSTVVNGRFRFLNNVTEGYLESGLFIADVELGDEIQRGSGPTTLRNYAVTLE